MFPPMARSLFYFFKNYFLENDISHHLFLFYFFIRENKIRKKTLNMTSYLEKTDCEKLKSDPGVRLLIRKVW